jgi:hypothetical protein
MMMKRKFTFDCYTQIFNRVCSQYERIPKFVLTIQNIRFPDKINKCNGGCEVPTAEVMKSNLFGDVMPCSPLKANRRFGGIYCLNWRFHQISRTQ